MTIARTETKASLSSTVFSLLLSASIMLSVCLPTAIVCSDPARENPKQPSFVRRHPYAIAAGTFALVGGAVLLFKRYETAAPTTPISTTPVPASAPCDSAMNQQQNKTTLSDANMATTEASITQLQAKQLSERLEKLTNAVEKSNEIQKTSSKQVNSSGSLVSSYIIQPLIAAAVSNPAIALGAAGSLFAGTSAWIYRQRTNAQIGQVQDGLTRANTTIYQVRTAQTVQGLQLTALGEGQQHLQTNVNQIQSAQIEHGQTLGGIQNTQQQQSQQLSGMQSSLSQQSQQLTAANTAIASVSSTLSAQGATLQQQGETLTQLVHNSTEQGQKLGSLNNTVEEGFRSIAEQRKKEREDAQKAKQQEIEHMEKLFKEAQAGSAQAQRELLDKFSVESALANSKLDAVTKEQQMQRQAMTTMQEDLTTIKSGQAKTNRMIQQGLRRIRVPSEQALVLNRKRPQLQLLSASGALLPVSRNTLPPVPEVD